MAQAGTTLGLGGSRTTPTNKPLGFWSVATLAAVAIAIVMATAFVMSTTKIGSAGLSSAPIDGERAAAFLRAGGTPVAVERYYSQSAAQALQKANTRLLPNGSTERTAAVPAKPASGYTQAEAQRGRHGKLP
ncbi:MAG: hypothetical protein ABJC39_02725 [Chloroflexota bacterium]